MNLTPMYIEARKQAEDRSWRDKEPIYVYQAGPIWFVRSDAEGAPDGAVLIDEVS